MKQKNVNAFSVLQLPGTCLLDTFIILFSDQGVRIIFSEAECHATGSITFIYDCLWRRTAMKTLAVHKGTGHISGLLLLRTALKISVQTSIHPFTSDCCLMKRWMGNWSFFLNRQVFHVCEMGGRQDSFLCPNGTIFSQKIFACDWWYNVECGATQRHYRLNRNLFQVSSNNWLKGEQHRF